MDASPSTDVLSPCANIKVETYKGVVVTFILYLGMGKFQSKILIYITLTIVCSAKSGHVPGPPFDTYMQLHVHSCLTSFSPNDCFTAVGIIFSISTLRIKSISGFHPGPLSKC